MSTKNLFLFFSLVGLMAMSCSKEGNFGEVTPQLEKVASRKVSSSEAKEFAGFIANSLFSKDGGPRLKSSTAEEHREVTNVKPIVFAQNDTVMYSVNFGNNLGYVILSADKQSFPIIAYIDSGSFDVNVLKEDSPIRAWFNEKSKQISDLLRQPVDTTAQLYQLWTNVVPNDSTEIEIEFASLPQIPLTKRGTREHSTGKGTVYPFTGQQYKWGQGTGYNFNAPFPGALVGCPAVAIGQLCVHHWFPSKYGYMYMPGELPTNYNQQNAISLMFRDIADSIPSYQWGTNVSGAIPNNLTIGLKRLGYKNALLRSYDFEIAYSNLRAGNPILLAGYQGASGGGGHVWFCDGYHEFSWIVRQYKKKLFGGKKLVREWTEYADYLHMNWGWGGSQGVNANGWYEQSNWQPNGGYASQGYLKQMYVNLYPVYN